MEFLFGIFIAIGGLLLVMVLRLVTTFFHEMGHAIPALMFTDKKVEVYIGSYGDISKTLRLNFGRLKMFIKINIFDWQIGLCRREGEIKSKWKTALIIIGGPIASLLISIPLMFKLPSLQSQEILFFLVAVFIAAAIIDLVVNLYPSATPMQMHDGGVAYSDGYSLRHLITESLRPAEYFELKELFHDDKHDALIKRAEHLIEENPKHRYLYDFIIASLEHKKEPGKIIEVYTYLKEHMSFDESDYLTIGKAYRQLDKYEDALRFFNKYYFKNYTSPELTSEMAANFISMGRYNEAIQSLDSMIHNMPAHYPFHLLKGEALIKLKDYESAKQSLDIAKKLNEKDPHLFYQFGMLYEKKNQYKLAILNLEKAKELGLKQAGLDFTIENLRGEINQ